MADKAKKENKSVVRNEAYRAGAFSVREKHNERLNVDYSNESIDPERAGLNIQFRRVTDAVGKPETYQQTFNRLLSEGVISRHGLKADAKEFDELVFDINTAYFENHGGYEYAKRFYEEAYRLAVELIGGEQYVLSAILHADERNSGLSKDLGRDVYHYHLHVVYIPVVRKEVYYQKSNKNPELAGKLREVITQISHSKKWPKIKNDKGYWVNSYSLLQDRFHDHMKAAGFDGFERGERGSTAEHLSDVEYKNQQEQKRADELAEQTAQNQRQLQATQQQLSAADKKLAEKKKQIKVATQTAATFADIEQAAQPATFGKKLTISQADWHMVSEAAKKGVVSDATISDLQRQLAASKKNEAHYRKQIEAAKKGDVTALMSLEEQITYYQKQSARETAERAGTERNVSANKQKGAR